MTRRDFQLIAGVLAETRHIEETSRVLYVDAFARVLAETNPRFDRGRFARACGIDPIVLLSVTEQQRAPMK